MDQARIYTGVSSRESNQHSIVALDAYAGTELWQYSLQEDSVSFPVYYDTHIFFSAGNGLYALQARDGSLVWRQQNRSRYSPPALSKEFVYVCSEDGTVSAFHVDDGSFYWQVSIQNIAVIRPVLLGDRIYVRSVSGSVYALHASNGSVLWQRQGREQHLIFLAAALDVVYLVEFGRGLSALRASDGTLLWFKPLNVVGLGDPMVDNGVLYLNTTSDIYAYQLSDGSLLWQVSLSHIISITARNARLFICAGQGTNGEVIALQAKDGASLWRWPTTLSQGGITVPSVAYETVYVGIGATDGLYALDSTTGNARWHALNGKGVTAVAVENIAR
jgi:outer membrane protein assembly factor BamB